ncbi:LOW QUALITY PROTEIN: ras-related protein Rab-35-like, partial [Pelodiscus sinensis]|uniref:LOW QUALITY PROTEIN: ras-related protein Rab-35-like n=1 Tax=Pelodiscus sinensis TaxID=13735 RepID=UPI003F6A9545
TWIIPCLSVPQFPHECNGANRPPPLFISPPSLPLGFALESCDSQVSAGPFPCPGGVGKSSLLLRFADNTFSGSYITTIGVDFKIRTLVINGERVKLQIWDTAGQERFRTITSTYYRNTHGVIIVYDVTNPESFVNVKRWLHEIGQNCDSVCKVLVGNKCEDSARRQVEAADARRFSEQMGVRLFETSAKENLNVEEMFNAVTAMVLRTKQENLARLQQPEVVKINKAKKKPAVKKCC